MYAWKIVSMHTGTANTDNRVLIAGVIGGVAVPGLIITAIVVTTVILFCVWQRSSVTGAYDTSCMYGSNS